MVSIAVAGGGGGVVVAVLVDFVAAGDGGASVLVQVLVRVCVVAAFDDGDDAGVHIDVGD